MRRAMCTGLSFALVFSFTMVPVNAQEWFDEGRTAYHVAGQLRRPWVNAAISVDTDRVEVYSRGGERELIATFTSGTVEHGIERRRRWREAALFGGSAAGGWAIGSVVASMDENRLPPSGKHHALMLGVVAGIFGITAATQAREPYTTLIDGEQMLRVRVDKDDLVRFEQSLARYADNAQAAIPFSIPLPTANLCRVIALLCGPIVPDRGAPDELRDRIVLLQRHPEQ